MEAFSLAPNISAESLSNLKASQYWNPQDELILKLSLHARFEQELAEILRVKEMALISKSPRFFYFAYMSVNCYKTIVKLR